jgi:hypothetical protein
MYRATQGQIEKAVSGLGRPPALMQVRHPGWLVCSYSLFAAWRAK